MGTNYYCKPVNSPEKCPTCGHTPKDEILHIGKSSAGWVFLLCEHPEHGITELEDWVARWQSGEYRIVDEYERSISMVDMLRVILVRYRPGLPPSTFNYRANNAEPAPLGLVRPAGAKKGVAGTYTMVPAGEWS